MDLLLVSLLVCDNKNQSRWLFHIYPKLFTNVCIQKRNMIPPDERLPSVAIVDLVDNNVTRIDGELQSVSFLQRVSDSKLKQSQSHSRTLQP